MVSAVVVIKFVLICAQTRSFAAPECCVVVDVWDFVAHVCTVVLLPLVYSLGVNKSLVLGLDAGGAMRGIGRVVPMLLFLQVVFACGQLFRDTLVRSGFPHEKLIDIFVESRVFLDDVIEQLFILGKLVLQILAVSEVDLVLEFVDVDTFVEKGVDVAEEVVQFVHAALVASVDEFAVGGFGADGADVGVPGSLFGEAVHAEEAVAVEDEFASLLEAGLAFVAMLGILVHYLYTLILVITSN